MPFIHRGILLNFECLLWFFEDVLNEILIIYNKYWKSKSSKFTTSKFYISANNTSNFYFFLIFFLTWLQEELPFPINFF